MNKIIISEVTIIPITNNTEGLLGFASLVINNALYLGSMGIYKRPNGTFRITYPLRKNTNNNVNFYFPICKELGEQIEKEITIKIEELLTKL